MSEGTVTPLATDAALADGEFELVILPQSGWFDWRLTELWRYRDLVMLLVWRDFVSVYKQTILGPAWHLLQPLLATLTFTIIFGRVAGLSTDGAPPFLFYLAGNVIWTYFATSLTNTSKTFVMNAPLLGKVYFHRMVIPLSIVVSNLVAFGIQFALFVLLLAVYGLNGVAVHLTAWAWLTPVFLLMLAGYGLGLGIIICALTTRYRDLANLVAFGVQLLMYATPVIYPVSTIPEGYRWIAQANPLTPIVEGFRLGFLGVGTVTPPQLLTSAAVMLLVLVVGVALFSRIERTFMDTV